MLRPLRVSDADQLAVINRLALGYDFLVEKTETQLAKFLKDDQHILIGVTDSQNQLVGYVHAQVYEATYSEAGLNILALAVLPPHQGQGLGRTLLSALEAQASQRGLAFIRLNSGSHRTEAHRFYEAVGYTQDKMQARFIKLLQPR